MSYTKKGKVFPIISRKKTALILGKILQEIYGGSSPTIKAIAALTSADLKTIKNWYAGRNAPHLSYFLELCANDQNFLCAVLKKIGYNALADYAELLKIKGEEGGSGASFEIYSIIFDTINSAEILDLIRKLNIRQVWFYGELKRGNFHDMQSLMRFWAVGAATAKRDLSDMVKMGIIHYVGSRRNGHYMLSGCSTVPD